MLLNLKRVSLLAAIILLVIMSAASMAPVKQEPVVVNLGNWFRDHPMPSTPGESGELVFRSDRSEVYVSQAPAGTHLLPRYHRSVDEVTYIVEGKAELWTNGAWMTLNPGDLHANPRGAVHALNVTHPKGAKFITVFTPPPQPQDTTEVSSETAVQASDMLIDSTPAEGIVVVAKQLENIIGKPVTAFCQKSGPMKPTVLMKTPRSAVLLQQPSCENGKELEQIAADEIVIVATGTVRSVIGDSVVTLGRNELQIIPLGMKRQLQLVPGEAIRLVFVLGLQTLTPVGP